MVSAQNPRNLFRFTPHPVGVDVLIDPRAAIKAAPTNAFAAHRKNQQGSVAELKNSATGFSAHRDNQEGKYREI